MRTTNAIVWDGDELVLVDHLEVVDPGPGEVQITLATSGICHSDLNVVDGVQPLPPPIVLGHEGAGEVAAVGAGVDHLAVGDRVLVSSMTPCGRCASCHTGQISLCRRSFGDPKHPFVLDGRPVRSYASVASFAGVVTVRADQAIALPDSIPFEQACLVGCAVTTGYGSARNVARVDVGHRVAVFGIGGVGANVVQTARLQRAGEIVAIDRDPGKEAAARRFGATDFVVATDQREVVDRLRVDGGVDVAFECSGAPVAIETAIESLGPGGTAVLVGIPRAGTRSSFDVGRLFGGRRIVGAFNGAIRPHADIPAILRLAERGELDLAGLVSATAPIADYREAIAEVRSGTGVRTVLRHG